MRLYPVLLATLAGLLLLASSASAATTWTVNDSDDGGDGTCHTSPGICTLRDAASSAGAGDTIQFSFLAPNTQINLASPVPITDGSLTIDGCAPGAATTPCVTIHAPGTVALAVGASGVTVRRVAITGASTGISSNASGSGLTVTGSWFGVSAAGVAEADTTGIALGAGGATIGGTPSDADRATTACDGTCNAFAGGTTGIQVTGGSGTSIRGNTVGFDGAGAGAPVSGIGIDVGASATETTVGGYLLGEGNVVQAGTYGISANGSQDSTLYDNLVGLNLTGTAKAAAGGVPSAFGILVSGPPNHEPRLFSNRVAIGGTAGTGTGGIHVGGNDAVLRGNVVGLGTGGQDVGGPAYGIHLSGDGAELGGTDPGAGNTIAHAASGGIDVAGAKNSLILNNTLTANGRGVLVHQLNANDGSEASGNVIGAATAATANVITGSVKDAIALLPRSNGAAGNPNAGNFVLVNTGSGNGSDPAKDLFLDLADPAFGGNALDGPGNTAAVNNGIAAPTVTSASGTVVRGAGAQPGATVRVFTRPAGAVGALGAYVGSGTATAGGTWTVTAGAALANGAKVVATQTGTVDGSSELSGEGTVDSAAPSTTITSGPSSNTLDTTPTFTFTSSEGGSTFECKLDASAYAPCTSPRTTPALGYGAHTFSVRAKDAVGNVDASPATRSFTVAKPAPRDTTPPTTTITKTPGKLTRSREPAFTFTSNEPSYIECSVDGKAYRVCGVIGPLKDGTHTLKARAVDGAGNTDATPATYVFRVDRTAPKVKLGATAKRKGKTLRIKVACPKAEKSGPCRGTLTVRRKGKLVARKAYRIKAGKTVTVVLKPKKLPAKGAKLALSTTAKDKLGNKKTVRKTAKVK